MQGVKSRFREYVHENDFSHPWKLISKTLDKNTIYRYTFYNDISYCVYPTENQAER